MSTIAVAGFGWSEQSMGSRASAGGPSATIPFILQCRACGFEPADVVVPPLRCPKCSGSSWERVVIPGSLLKRADELMDPASRPRMR
jgi:hypothetical protein